MLSLVSANCRWSWMSLTSLLRFSALLYKIKVFLSFPSSSPLYVSPCCHSHPIHSISFPLVLSQVLKSGPHPCHVWTPQLHTAPALFFLFSLCLFPSPSLLLRVRLVPQVLLEMAPVPVMIWQGCHHCPSHLSGLVLLHFHISVRTSIPDPLSTFTRRVKAPTVGKDFKN